MILYLKLEKQLLSKLNEEVIAAGDSNVDQCTFEFDGYWAGYTKTAVFYQNKSNVQYALLDDKDSCFIPAAAMQQAGKLHMGVFGIKGTQVLTSTVVDINLEEGAISGIEIDVEPSDDIYLAIVAQYQSLAAQMDLHNKTAAEIKAEFNRQNEILNSLNAFDAIQLEEEVAKLKEVSSEHTDKIEKLETSFVLSNVTISFESNEFSIEDARVTEESLVDLYFSTDSFEEATDAGITVESEKECIKISCAYIPSFPLYASVLVRVV